MRIPGILPPVGDELWRTPLPPGQGECWDLRGAYATLPFGAARYATRCWAQADEAHDIVDFYARVQAWRRMHPIRQTPLVDLMTRYAAGDYAGGGAREVWMRP